MHQLEGAVQSLFFCFDNSFSFPLPAGASWGEMETPVFGRRPARRSLCLLWLLSRHCAAESLLRPDRQLTEKMVLEP